MRRGRNNGWLSNEKNGDLIGINLGSDGCAEHEWGIKGLKVILGVPVANEEGRGGKRITDYGGVYGMDRRRCAKPTPECIALKEEGDTLNLIVMRQHSIKYLLENPLERSAEWSFRREDEVVTAWNEGGLIVRVKGEKNFNKLRHLHATLMGGGCCVWLGGGGVFENAGLCLAIYNAIPEASLESMRDGDIDREKLNRASQATGIEEKIDKENEQWCKMQEVETGRHCYEKKWGYYALSPRWVGKDERKTTKHPVTYWLNPMEQDENNYGWFSVEQLEQWLKGEGPIPKKKSRVSTGG